MKRIIRLLPLCLSAAMLLLSAVLFHIGSTPFVQAQEPELPSIPFSDQRDAAQKAVTWLIANHQNQDGGYSSFSAGADQAPSDVGGTLDAILALGSAGVSTGAAVPGKSNNPIDFLSGNINSLQAYAADDAAQAGKAVLALAAANQDPAAFNGVDFVSFLTSQVNSSGQFGSATPIGQSLAMLALEAIGEQVPATAVNWLMNQQAVEGDLAGSWDDGYGTAGNIDATALSLMALAASGSPVVTDSVSSAADFLLMSQLDSGGWEYAADLGENANSTALAVQAMAALGLDFYTANGENPSPMMALLAWQGETGAFQADFGDGPFDDFYATVQALPGVMGKHFPLLDRRIASHRALACLATLQDEATGGWEQFATFGVDAAGTSRAIQAIAAMGDDPASSTWTVGEINAVQALAALAPAYVAVSGGGGVGIVMQGVVAAGGDVADFAGMDLALAVTGHLSPTGEYDNTAFGPFSHVEAMLGLLSAGLDPDPAAVEWLLSAQTDGDFGGADSTGIALQALAKLDLDLPQALQAVRTSQEVDGGWGFGSANPSSTSEVVQALVALGENPFGLAWSKVLSGTVVTAADAVLRQQGENGCWPNLFGPGDDPYSTTDAILMLAVQPGWGRDREVILPELISDEPQVTETPEPALISAPAETPEDAVAPGEITPQPPDEEPVAPSIEQPSSAATPTTPPAPEAVPPGNLAPLVLIGTALFLVAAAARYLYRGR